MLGPGTARNCTKCSHSQIYPQRHCTFPLCSHGTPPCLLGAGTCQRDSSCKWPIRLGPGTFQRGMHRSWCSASRRHSIRQSRGSTPISRDRSGTVRRGSSCTWCVPSRPGTVQRDIHRSKLSRQCRNTCQTGSPCTRRRGTGPGIAHYDTLHNSWFQSRIGTMTSVQQDRW